MSLVANARMYAVSPAVAALWGEFFAQVSRVSGVDLTVIPHGAPAPLEDLWQRDDLGLAFICGFPFAGGRFAVEPVAAPIPLSGDGRPVYATHLVTRADGPIRTLSDSFGTRIGWTVEHSQSGFNAMRTHLLPYRRKETPLYAESVGPLLTPRRVIEAVLDGTIDLGPLDSYFYDLLLAHEPETAAMLRIVDTTAPSPVPLLVASRTVDEATVGRLSHALLGMAQERAGQSILAGLRLAGFAKVEAENYHVLLRRAEAADAAEYPVPA